MSNTAQRNYSLEKGTVSKVYRIAIVEDSPEDGAYLVKQLRRFELENQLTLDLICFKNAMDFEDTKRTPYDIIFMDIEMPLMTGMEAAHSLRERDQEAILIFITNMKQYAIEGYSVNAMDYLLKPVSYPQLAQVFHKALRQLSGRTEKFISLPSATGIRRVSVKDIISIEIKTHRITWNLIDGTIDSWGTLKEAEKLLPERQFARCNSWTLINLRHLEGFDDEDVIVHGLHFHIARSRKKELLQAFSDYLGL